MLKITRLGHAYAGRSVLSVEFFSLIQGRHALLLGPSGSGKSTLLNLIAGILTLQSGSIVLDDTDLADLSPREADSWRASHVGLLPQQLALIPSLSVADNIALPAYAVGKDPDVARVRELLAALDLGDYASAKPRQLSQGQRQRVAMARAVYTRPRLILADEPTANLDDANCARVVELLLAQAAATRASLIVASHDVRVMESLPETQLLRLPAATTATAAASAIGSGGPA
ncbi:ABC transporter ATP-binding protein [Massilia sp. 9096]|uniref:ABC transporter ATP-binding protein n=1 Tax=Massilia sp. 9096 TaxID=1500894 RepID=UPI00068AE75E|nr:ATP-binding cassette domain-containing protein [Massilia sp. 9096]